MTGRGWNTSTLYHRCWTRTDILSAGAGRTGSSAVWLILTCVFDQSLLHRGFVTVARVICRLRQCQVHIPDAMSESFMSSLSNKGSVQDFEVGYKF